MKEKFKLLHTEGKTKQNKAKRKYETKIKQTNKISSTTIMRNFLIIVTERK